MWSLGQDLLPRRLPVPQSPLSLKTEAEQSLSLCTQGTLFPFFPLYGEDRLPYIPVSVLESHHLPNSVSILPSALQSLYP